MLKKLRIKFIALNMATVAVVLAVIFSAICVINYQQSVASVHEAMSNAIAFTESKSRALTDGDAQGQEGAREQDAGDPDDQANGDWEDDGARHGTPPQIGGGVCGSTTHVPVAVYRILKSGSYALAGSAASASSADDVLEKAISQLADAPDGSGEHPNWAFFTRNAPPTPASSASRSPMSAPQADGKPSRSPSRVSAWSRSPSSS